MPRHRKRDQDGIYQRPDSPAWWATLQRPGGGATRRSTGVPVAGDPDGTQARAVRAGWIAAGPQAPAAQPKAGPTFDELMLAALEDRRSRGCDWGRDKSATRPLYEAFAGRPLETITGADVRAYIAARRDAGLSAGGINKEIGLMSSAVNWAVRELEWSAPNPWEGRRLREPAGRTRYLTREEAALLFAAADARRTRWPWIADFCRLCVFTGLRTGEALGLEWSRVDLTARRISFLASDQKSRKRGAIPINESARAALLERAKFRATWCPGSPWVFCRRNGSRVLDIKKGFAAAAAQAGLVDLHPHDLRRTCGSWLVQAGVGIERVSELLRHGDVRITAQVYAHLRPGDLAAAAGVLDTPQGTGFTPGFTPAAEAQKSRS